MKGRRVYMWATQDLEEDASASPTPPTRRTARGSPSRRRARWSDVAHWYAPLAQGRYELTPAIEARAAEIARRREDARRHAEPPLPLGRAGLPLRLALARHRRLPAASAVDGVREQVRRLQGQGDLLRRRRPQARLPGLPGAAQRRAAAWTRSLPSAQQFDHMIAAVAKPGGGFQFLDLTAEIVPYGDLPPDEQGEFGLLVHDDGTRDRGASSPSRRRAPTARTVTIVGELTVTGGFNGRWTTTATGNHQYEHAPADVGHDEARLGGARADDARGGELARAGLHRRQSAALRGARPRARCRATRCVIHGGKLLTERGRHDHPRSCRSTTSRRRTPSRRSRRAGRARSRCRATRVWGPDETVQELRLTLPVGLAREAPGRTCR